MTVRGYLSRVARLRGDRGWGRHVRVGTALGGRLAGIVLVGAALAVGCGGDDAPEQARDRASVSVPSPTATPTPTSTTTLTTLNCSILGNCSPTPAATGTARTPTATASPTPTRAPTVTRTPTTVPPGTPFSTFICSFAGNCPPTPTATAPSPTASPTTSPSAAQLRSALLTEADLGRDWQETGRRDLMGRAYPAAQAAFLNLLADESLDVQLYDARNGSVETLALRTLTEITPRATSAAPLGYGTRGVRYRYSLVEGDEQFYGELAAWQQGPVVMIMLIEGSQAEICLCDLARRQDDKLRAMFRR